MRNGEYILTRYRETNHYFIPQYYKRNRWVNFRTFWGFTIKFDKGESEMGRVEAEAKCKKAIDNILKNDEYLTNELDKNVITHYPE